MCKLEEKGFEARNEKRGVGDARAVNSVATGGTDGRRGEGVGGREVVPSRMRDFVIQ